MSQNTRSPGGRCRRAASPWRSRARPLGHHEDRVEHLEGIDETDHGHDDDRRDDRQDDLPENLRGEAPSTRAASRKLVGSALIDDRTSTATKGMYCQVLHEGHGVEGHLRVADPGNRTEGRHSDDPVGAGGPYAPERAGPTAMIMGISRILTRPRDSLLSSDSIMATTTPITISTLTDSAAKMTLLRRKTWVSLVGEDVQVVLQPDEGPGGGKVELVAEQAQPGPPAQGDEGRDQQDEDHRQHEKPGEVGPALVPRASFTMEPGARGSCCACLVATPVFFTPLAGG